MIWKRHRKTCLISLLVPLVCVGIVGVLALIVYSNAPQPPLSKNFTPKPTEAATFDQLIRSAGDQAKRTGKFRLTFNQQQLSSWMSLEGESFAAERGYYFDFHNVQVGLDNGVMTFYAEVASSDLNLPLQVVIRPVIDDQGHLHFEIDQAQLGGLGVPEFLLEDLVAQIEDLLVKPFQELRGDYVMLADTLRVENGRFTVAGELR